MILDRFRVAAFPKRAGQVEAFHDHHPYDEAQ
jgi:hypothetical protein